MAIEKLQQLPNELKDKWRNGGKSFRGLIAADRVEREEIIAANETSRRVQKLLKVQAREGLTPTVYGILELLESDYPGSVLLYPGSEAWEPTLLTWSVRNGGHRRAIRFVTSENSVEVELTRQTEKGEEFVPVKSISYHKYRDEVLNLGMTPAVDPMKGERLWTLMDRALMARDLAHPVSNSFFEGI